MVQPASEAPEQEARKSAAKASQENPVDKEQSEKKVASGGLVAQDQSGQTEQGAQALSADAVEQARVLAMPQGRDDAKELQRREQQYAQV